MFVRRKEHMEAMRYYERAYEDLRGRYWKLWHAHQRVLDHLGLVEVEVREHTELRPRTGKEDLP